MYLLKDSCHSNKHLKSKILYNTIVLSQYLQYLSSLLNDL
nr:MAG TPA: hypothetical protein [Caudoviricetes sp.]